MKSITRSLTVAVHIGFAVGCVQAQGEGPEEQGDAAGRRCLVEASVICGSNSSADAASIATDASASGGLGVDAAPFVDPVDAATVSSSTITTEGVRETSSRADESSSSSLPPEDAGPCDVPLHLELSPHISTVVLLTWTEPDGWSEAHIEYWSEGEKRRDAAIELGSPDPTPLIGLIPDTVYEYRVTAKRSSRWCSSGSREIRTGSAPELLPLPVVSMDDPNTASGGYLLTTPESEDPDASGYVALYDSVGRPVWWFRTSLPGLLSRAHFSWDGREVWVRDANPLGRAAGRVVRVPVDGSSEELIEMDLGHHDFVPVPNGFLFLVGGGEDTCDIIQHRSKEGEVTPFYALRDAFGETFRPGELNACHCNAIDYNPDDESVSVSCLNQNAFVKISSHGQLVWVLGGNNGQSHFSGDVNWDRQHGHHLLNPTRIVFFNNMGGGDSEDTGSLAVELQLNLETKTAERVWEYASDADSAILGDAQYLPNGNVLVTYSNSGELHEVNPSRERVRLWKFPSGIGYSQHYESRPEMR